MVEGASAPGDVGHQRLRTPAAEGLRWIACGAAIVRRAPALWLGMAATYLLIALALAQIPFLGQLVLVLISPLLACGALLTAASRPSAAVPGPAWHRILETWARAPARALVRAARREEQLFAAILLCILTLGLVLLAQIAGYLLIGGSLITGLSADKFLEGPRLLLVLAVIAVAVVHVILAMALLFSAHRTVLANRPPMAALAESFELCRRHPAAVAALLGVSIAAYVLLELSFRLSPWIGYLLWASAGVAALAVFVGASYCGYRALGGAAD